MLLTVGHGAAGREGLGELLVGAGVTLVVDVRRYPASRTNPDVRRGALEDWLPEVGVDYRWEPRLTPHRPAEGTRLGDDADVHWDA